MKPATFGERGGRAPPTGRGLLPGRAIPVARIDLLVGRLTEAAEESHRPQTSPPARARHSSQENPAATSDNGRRKAVAMRLATRAAVTVPSYFTTGPRTTRSTFQVDPLLLTVPTASEPNCVWILAAALGARPR